MRESTNKAANKPLHFGHRKRMKDTLIKYGASSLKDHELIEMLLFYSINRRNTNDLAHKLMNEFGGLREIVSAPIESLVSVNGIGVNTAVQLKLISELYKRISFSDNSARTRFDTLSKVGELCMAYFNMDTKERLCAMIFDPAMHLITICELSCGNANATRFDVGELIRIAVIKNASRIILAHNHPSGIDSPSLSDRIVTSNAQSALATISIPLIEHLVISEHGYTPMLIDNILPAIKKDDISDKARFYKYFYEN